MTEKQSRPLLTKMLAKVIEQGYAGALREREAVERSRKSRSDSLAANLIHYERALQRLERVSAEVEQQVASMGDTQKRETPWPDPPPKLRRPWPNTFPPRPILPERPPAPDAGANGRTNAGIEIPAAFHPDNVEFDLSVGEYEVTLTARYADGINRFEDALENFLEGRTSSRWYAIGEAQRAGIRWPQLDRYLAECPTPWLPEEFVGERFGLRGTLAFRDRMADLMSLISPEAAFYYFDTPPGAFEATPVARRHGAPG